LIGSFFPVVAEIPDPVRLNVLFGELQGFSPRSLEVLRVGHGTVLIRKIRFFFNRNFFLQLLGHKYQGLGPDFGLSKKSGSRSVFSVRGTATETLGKMLGKNLANLCF
jgi:hypothetical protein